MPVENREPKCITVRTIFWHKYARKVILYFWIFLDFFTISVCYNKNTDIYGNHTHSGNNKKKKKKKKKKKNNNLILINERASLTA